MSEETKNQGVEPIGSEERNKIIDAFSVKHGAALRPGESLQIQLERTKDHGMASLSLEASDGTSRIELEAAVLADDAHAEEIQPAARFELALNFLDAMFESFLAEGREERFHPDWRLYEFESAVVRFRGNASRPDLEALADAWLASGGNPGDEDDA